LSPIDIVKFSIKAMRVRKRRTVLTLVGIAVGVMTLTAVVSYVEGYGDYIGKLLKGPSLRTIYVIPRGELLQESDISKLMTIPHVERASPIVRIPARISIYGTEENVIMTGIDPYYVQDALPDLRIMEGVMPQGDEGGAVIGYSLAKRFTEDPRAVIGTTFKAYGSSIRITAVAAPYGTSIFTDVDNSFIIPLGLANRLKRDVFGLRGYDTVMLIVDSEENTDQVLDELRSYFSDTAYFISMRDIQKALGQLIDISALILGAIASMTIVVASIGMMNAMYTTVTERTKIIGVMRALGASKRDIILLFLFEAVITGIIGIVSGIVLGYLGAYVFSFLSAGGMRVSMRSGPHASQMAEVILITPKLPAEVVLAISLVTIAINIAGAVPPSLMAARLEPSEALRYE
jgi:putative ABC transport system permease protein